MLSFADVLDTARVFPAEHPGATPHLPRNGASVYYRLLRPDFVHGWRKPLNPDALSGFSLHDPAVLEHRTEVREATVALVERVKSLAGSLDAVPATWDVSEFLHRWAYHPVPAPMQFTAAAPHLYACCTCLTPGTPSPVMESTCDTWGCCEPACRSLVGAMLRSDGCWWRWWHAH